MIQRILQELVLYTAILTRWRNLQDMLWKFTIERFVPFEDEERGLNDGSSPGYWVTTGGGSQGTVSLDVLHMEEAENGWFRATLADQRVVMLRKEWEKCPGVRCEIKEGTLADLPQLLSDEDLMEFRYLSTNMEACIQRIAMLGNPGFTSTLTDQRAAAVALRESGDTEESRVERGVSLQREPEEIEPGLRVWERSDNWEHEHGLGQWEVQLNFYIQSKNGSWRKCKTRTYLKPFDKKEKCGDPAIPEEDVSFFIDELKARCRDEDWDSATVVENFSMRRLKGAWDTRYCGNCKKKTKHAVQPDHLHCTTRGCNRRLDRYWIEVEWSMGTLPFCSAPDPVCREWNTDNDVSWKTSVMLMGRKARELKTRLELVSVASTL